MKSNTAAVAWAGIDVGKSHHWMCLIDESGSVLLSMKVPNSESAILSMIAEAQGKASEVRWAVDIIGTSSALLLALLRQSDQHVRYASGRVAAAMSPAFPGEGKTDAKDSHVIAQTARLRADLPAIDAAADRVRELELLSSHRDDLVADRVRMINRMRDLLTSVAPSLEEAFDYSSSKGALTLLTGYSSPARIRKMGQARLGAWLRKRHVRSADDVAARAIEAASAQRIELPGADLAAAIISELASSILELDARLKQLEAQIAEVFRAHPRAASIESMPGFGPILGAMLLVAMGDQRSYPDAGHLAAAAGLAPVPNDSGRRVGNLHRPKRYSRPLRHAFYLSAQTAMMRPGPSRDYYLKKRDSGKTHTQAVIALARRRVDVLWALMRDNRTFTAEPPRTEPIAA